MKSASDFGNPHQALCPKHDHSKLRLRFAATPSPEQTRRRTQTIMALETRQNPETGQLEILAHNQWVPFEQYRKTQIEAAYQTSVQFLRERLGEEHAQKTDATESTQ
jgi:hypothetical protein